MSADASNVLSPITHLDLRLYPNGGRSRSQKPASTPSPCDTRPRTPSAPPAQPASKLILTIDQVLMPASFNLDAINQSQRSAVIERLLTERFRHNLQYYSLAQLTRILMDINPVDLEKFLEIAFINNPIDKFDKLIHEIKITNKAGQLQLHQSYITFIEQLYKLPLRLIPEVISRIKPILQTILLKSLTYVFKLHENNIQLPFTHLDLLILLNIFYNLEMPKMPVSLDDDKKELIERFLLIILSDVDRLVDFFRPIKEESITYFQKLVSHNLSKHIYYLSENICDLKKNRLIQAIEQFRHSVETPKELSPEEIEALNKKSKSISDSVLATGTGSATDPDEQELRGVTAAASAGAGL